MRLWRFCEPSRYATQLFFEFQEVILERPRVAPERNICENIKYFDVCCFSPGERKGRPREPGNSILRAEGEALERRSSFVWGPRGGPSLGPS